MYTKNGHLVETAILIVVINSFLSPFHKYDVLHVLCVGEHVDGLNFDNLILLVQKLYVASLGCGVAAYVYNPLWSCKQDGVYDVLVHASAWWVGDDDVGTTMLLYKLTVKDVLHVASIE